MATLSLVQQALTLLSGVLVGFTLGLIGGGGSILAVPLLLYLVGYRDPHVVIGTTALAVALTAWINVIPHWRAGHVRWPAAVAFALPGAVGAALGASLGKVVPGKQLLFWFAILMVAVAISMLRPRAEVTLPPRQGRAMVLRTVPAGLIVGLLAGFFGIGGGFLIVPALVLATGMPLIAAIGTSLVAVGALGTTTAITYALGGLVNWLIAFEYLAGGIVGGFAGARLATHLSRSAKILPRIFAAVVFLVAIYMFSMNAPAFHL